MGSASTTACGSISAQPIAVSPSLGDATIKIACSQFTPELFGCPGLVLDLSYYLLLPADEGTIDMSYWILLNFINIGSNAIWDWRVPVLPKLMGIFHPWKMHPLEVLRELVVRYKDKDQVCVIVMIRWLLGLCWCAQQVHSDIFLFLFFPECSRNSSVFLSIDETVDQLEIYHLNFCHL